MSTKVISENLTNTSFMHPEEVELSLRSSEPEVDYNYEVTLKIIAYLRSGDIIDANTLIFRCDPVGTNYDTSYLQVTFDDWSKVEGIRSFLADCFSDETLSRRAMSIEVDGGVSSITPHGQPPKEQEELDEIIIEVDRERIEFQRSGSLLPYIFTYEEKIDRVPQDQNNVDKLLDFFDKIISFHPDFGGNSGNAESPEIEPVLNQPKVEMLLSKIVATDSRLIADYQKAVQEFEDREYGDTVRDVGRAAEKLIEEVTLELSDEGDVSNKTGRKLNYLDKSTDGLPSFIGKTISPLWWLRNRVAHPNNHEVSEQEAHYALLCFQIAAEAFVDEFKS